VAGADHRNFHVSIIVDKILDLKVRAFSYSLLETMKRLLQLFDTRLDGLSADGKPGKDVAFSSCFKDIL